MKVVSCDPGETTVSPAAYNACAFEIIDKWDPKQHAKTCDTMFYMRNGTGAYVWDCDEWIFLDFSGYTVADWDAEQNQQGYIGNKPFKKLGKIFTVSKEGVLSVSITPADIGAYTKEETDEEFAKKTGNVASADKLATARKISLSGMASGSASFDGTKDISIDATVQNGTTSQKGVVQLTDSTSSDSKTTAATPSSVKKVQVALDDHEKDFENPHQVKAGQTGAFTKEESSANVVNQIGGTESAILKKEFLVNGTEGTASRHVKDLPYENMIYNGMLEKPNDGNYAAVNQAKLTMIRDSDKGFNYLKVESSFGTNTMDRGVSFRIGRDRTFPIILGTTGTAGVLVWTDDPNMVGKKAYLNVAWGDTWQFIKKHAFTLPSEPTVIEAEFSVTGVNTISKKLNVAVMDGEVGTPLIYNATQPYLTTSTGEFKRYYPAPEDYGIVHGQPNLVDYSDFTKVKDMTDFQKGWEGKSAGLTFTFSTSGLTVVSSDSSSRDSCRFYTTRANLELEQDITYTTLLEVEMQKDSKIYAGGYSHSNTYTAGYTGLHQVVFESHQVNNSTLVSVMFLSENVPYKLIGIKTIRARKGAMDEWTPSQADSGLTPVNGGMVPFSEKDYADLLSEDGVVRGETLDVGQGAGIQFDFIVIKTLEERYPFLFENDSTIAEKITKYKSILKQFRITHTSRGGGISTTSGNVVNRSRMRIKTGSTTWGGIGDTNTTDRFISVTTPWIEPYRNIMNNDGTITATVVSKNNNVVEAGVVSDGVTPAWVEVKDIRLTIELEVNGRTIIEELMAANHVENLATQEEAEAGEDNYKIMTPLRTAQEIDKRAVTVGGNQTVSGTKNFKDGIQIDGNPVGLVNEACWCEDFTVNNLAAGKVNPDIQRFFNSNEEYFSVSGKTITIKKAGVYLMTLGLNYTGLSSWLAYGISREEGISLVNRNLIEASTSGSSSLTYVRSFTGNDQLRIEFNSGKAGTTMQKVNLAIVKLA